MTALLITLLLIPQTFHDWNAAKASNAELEGVYAGTWKSVKFDADGELILKVVTTGDVVTLEGTFTGSEYFDSDTFSTTVNKVRDGLWTVRFKGKRSKISGTGIFRDGHFSGDYVFSKLMFTDRGKWELERAD